MKLLVTRPLHQAAATVAILEEDGHECIVSPMLDLHRLDLPRPNGDFDIIVLTSRNAVDGLARQWHSLKDHGKRGDWTVFTVGDATKEAAVSVGFVKAVSCAGSAVDLVDQVTEVCDNGVSPEMPGNPRLLYPCALRPSQDLATLFDDRGFTCAAWPVYAMEEATAFSSEAETALKAGTLDGVLLYSARSAETYGELASKFGDTIRYPPVFALSANICAQLPKRQAVECRAAAELDEASLRFLLSQHKN